MSHEEGKDDEDVELGCPKEVWRSAVAIRGGMRRPVRIPSSGDSLAHRITFVSS